MAVLLGQAPAHPEGSGPPPGRAAEVPPSRPKRSGGSPRPGRAVDSPAGRSLEGTNPRGDRGGARPRRRGPRRPPTRWGRPRRRQDARGPRRAAAAGGEGAADGRAPRAGGHPSLGTKLAGRVLPARPGTLPRGLPAAVRDPSPLPLEGEPCLSGVAARGADPADHAARAGLRKPPRARRKLGPPPRTRLGGTRTRDTALC